jgi:hypothetical protein
VRHRRQPRVRLPLKRIALDDAGNILGLVEAGQPPMGGQGKVAVFRVTPDGRIDRTFAGGGSVIPYDATRGVPDADMYVRDGKMVIVGTSMFTGIPNGYSLMRLNVGPLVVRENDAPALTAPAPRTVNEGDAVTLTIPFSDPDVEDAHIVTINWGDGSAPEAVQVPAGTSTY